MTLLCRFEHSIPSISTDGVADGWLLAMNGFWAELEAQRWDDHRLYHRSYINQSLHFVSACLFLISYGLLFIEPVAAVFIGWLLAMLSRQAGHFFFEPKDFDEANGVTHAYKESIKVGFNLRRKVVLLSLWAMAPFGLWLSPDFLGLLAVPETTLDWMRNLTYLWLTLAFAGLMYRTLQLFFVRSPQTGMVWFTKILTDPFNDIRMYHRSPLRLLRGERIDPMTGAGH